VRCSVWPLRTTGNPMLAQTLVDALSVGSLFALSALGIGLIFGVMRLMNFAQGEFIMVGGYVLLWLLALGVPFAITAAVVIVVLVALATERMAFRHAREAKPVTLLITSYAVSYLLQNLMVMMAGARPMGIDFRLTAGEPLVIGNIRIATIHLITIAVTAFFLVAIALFLKRTSLGLAMRAAAVDFRMARLVGIPANRVIATAFAMSGVLAAVTSVLLLAETGTVSPKMGAPLALIGFVAAVIGGVGSLTGAVLGGFLVGGVSVFLQAALPGDVRPMRDALAYTIVIGVLLLRPQGLLRGKEAVERV
jgi:branched-chain amino acid transport system permease protein